VHQVLAALPLPRRGELTGDVLYIEQVAGEQPDFDWCRMLTRLVWCGITIVVPLVMLHVVFTHLGPLSGLLALFGLYLVFKWLSPTNVLSLVHLGILFNPFGRRNDPTVPVRHLRVRTPEGYETMVRMKGRPLRGAVMQDDEMTFQGTWRDGVLFSRRAFSHRTRSWVEMEVAQSWAGLLASLMVLLTLLYYLHAVVSPLVDKAQTVSSPTWQ
jgi:hypothetical protein